MSRIPLAMLPQGAGASVREFCGGEKALHRLTEMGLVRGAYVSVLQNKDCGPLMLSLGDSRIAIGRGLAMKVLVEEESRAGDFGRTAAL
jgi:ferrous iron transport protein A